MPRVFSMTERECGACFACCRDPLITDPFFKPSFALCPHHKGHCVIYPDRPPVCREFSCLWLMGGLEDTDRPDLNKVIVFAREVQGVPTLFLLTFEQALPPRGETIAAAFADMHRVIVTRYETTTREAEEQE